MRALNIAAAPLAVEKWTGHKRGEAMSVTGTERVCCQGVLVVVVRLLCREGAKRVVGCVVITQA